MCFFICILQYGVWKTAFELYLTGKCEVTSVALMQGGKLAVTGAGDRTVRVWDVDKGKFHTLSLVHWPRKSNYVYC